MEGKDVSKVKGRPACLLAYVGGGSLRWEGCRQVKETLFIGNRADTRGQWAAGIGLELQEAGRLYRSSMLLSQLVKNTAFCLPASPVAVPVICGKVWECACVCMCVGVSLPPPHSNTLLGSGTTKLAHPLILQMRNWGLREQTWFTPCHGGSVWNLAFSSSVSDLIHTGANQEDVNSAELQRFSPFLACSFSCVL